ncbi:Uma2 family endonuclease [Microseira sp. BLCC-F43]|jgi:Uma2 family endonuclease|uniref:Uma2 family endonuclease n=1 Tax=Microseira sp. BLCC-F43 TaxID=3153602 RepID=UPI0035B97CD7
MPVTTPIRQIQLKPGSVVIIPHINWQEFEQILEELGEKRSTRIAYSQGTLEIMSPLPQHERAIVVISDLVKTLLRKQQRPWESLRSTTFKRQGIAGIEPDDCFYIQNYRAIIGKDRIDIEIDPPPDLAIESDLTSKTETDAYTAIKVPELWIYGAGKFVINLLQNDEYVESIASPTFPDLPITDIIPRMVERAREIGMYQVLLEFEAWLDASLRCE